MIHKWIVVSVGRRCSMPYERSRDQALTPIFLLLYDNMIRIAPWHASKPRLSWRYSFLFKLGALHTMTLKSHIFFSTTRISTYEQSTRSLRAQFSWSLRRFTQLGMCSSLWGYWMFIMIVSLHQINYDGHVIFRIKEDVFFCWGYLFTSSFMRGANCHGTTYSINLFI